LISTEFGPCNQSDLWSALKTDLPILSHSYILFKMLKLTQTISPTLNFLVAVPKLRQEVLITIERHTKIQKTRTPIENEF